MNERTLLSFIVYGVRKDNIQNFPAVFINGVVRVLTMEGIDETVIDKVLGEYSQIALTKTDSKSLLGNMTDLVHMYTHLVLYDGGLINVDLFEVIARINRTPQRNIRWHNSAQAVKDILSAKRH